MKLAAPAVRLLAFGAVAVALARALGACSSEDPEVAPLDGGPSDASVDGTTTDGGSSGEPAGPSINVYLAVDPFRRTVGASSVVSDPRERPACERLRVGDCLRIVCAPSDGGAPREPARPLGVITWTGFSADEDGGATVPFTVVDPGTRSVTASFRGQEPVHVSAAGGEVPGYEQDLAVPLGLLVTNRTEDAGTAPAVILRAGEDTVLTWDRGSADVAFYFEIGGTVGPSPASVACTFPSAAGVGTIAAALTDKLEEPVVRQTYTWRRETTARGGYQVTTGVIFPVLTPEKKSASFVFRR